MRERFGGPRRRHGAALPTDRRELEESGWRTTLEYRENHVRGWDGRLRQLRVVWYAEAEREAAGADPIVVTASAATVERAWSRLRANAELTAVRGERRAPQHDAAITGSPTSGSGPVRPRRRHRVDA